MKQLLPDLFTFTGLLVGRVYAIQDADGLTLVDAGLSFAANRILRQLAAAGYRPGDVKRILVTHAHADHVGGLPRLKAATGAHVITSTVEAPLVEGRAPVPRPPAEALSFPDTLMAMGESRPLDNPTPVDRQVTDGEILTDVMGGLQAVLTPGHTPGHTAYWQPERRILFCGDVIMRFVRLSLPFAAATPDMAENRRSIARVAALEPAIVCFGHGQPMMDDTAAQISAFARRAAV